MADIPIVETYRGVGIHDCQPTDRIEKIVKPSIDHILALGNLEQLAAYAGDIARPPEARLLALAKCQAIFDIAVSERRERPAIDMDRVRASAIGCGYNNWRNPLYYGSLFDAQGPSGQQCPQLDRREIPLTRDNWKHGG